MNPDLFPIVTSDVTLGETPGLFFVIIFLIVRYMGVIGVLSLLMIGMIISGSAFKSFEQKTGIWYETIRFVRERVRSWFPGRRTPVKQPQLDVSDEALLAGEVPKAGVPPEAVAAIALALHLHRQQHRAPSAVAHAITGGPSPWAVSGRISQLNANTFR